MKNAIIPLQFKIKRPEEGFEVESLFPYLQEIFEQCFNFICFRPGSIELLVFADPDLFAETVYEYQDRAGRVRGFTQGYYTAAGKAIPRMLEDGSVTSTVVMDARVIWRLIEICEEGVPFSEWGVYHRLWLEMLVHEFGHCLDSAVRGEVGDRPPDVENVDDYRDLARHYVNVMKQEFIACAYTGSAVNPELQQHLIADWHTMVRDGVRPLVDSKFSLWNLGGLMKDVTHVFWVILVEYAKLIGHTVTNPELGDVPAWPSAYKEEGQALRQTAEVLRQLWVRYPNLPAEDELLEQLMPQWRALTEAHGFFFRDEEEYEEVEAD